MSKDNPLDKLARLTGSKLPPPDDDDDELTPEEQELADRAEKVCEFAAGLVGREPSVFDVQEVVEAAAEMLRYNIRDLSEGDDED